MISVSALGGPTMSLSPAEAARSLLGVVPTTGQGCVYPLKV